MYRLQKIRKKRIDIFRQIDYNIINNLRKQLDLNQQEKESIQLKLKQTEINLQEKSKIEEEITQKKEDR